MAASWSCYPPEVVPVTDLKFYREVLFPLAKGLIVGETQKEMDGREQRLWDDVASGLQTPGVIDIVQELDAIWRRGGITAPSPPVAPKPPTSSPHDKCCDRMSLLEDNGHLVCTKCAIVHSVISEWSFEQIKGMGPSLPTPVAKSSVNQAVHDIISRTHGTVSRLAGIAIEQLVTERVARGVSIRTITEHQQADIIRIGASVFSTMVLWSHKSFFIPRNGSSLDPTPHRSPVRNKKRARLEREYHERLVRERSI